MQICSKIGAERCYNVDNTLPAKEQIVGVLQHFKVKVKKEDILSRCQVSKPVINHNCTWMTLLLTIATSGNSLFILTSRFATVTTFYRYQARMYSECQRKRKIWSVRMELHLGTVGMNTCWLLTRLILGTHLLWRQESILGLTLYLRKYLALWIPSTFVSNVERFSGRGHTWLQHVNSLLMYWTCSL